VRRETSFAIAAALVAALTLAAGTASRLAAEPRAPGTPDAATKDPRTGQIPPASAVTPQAPEPGFPTVEQVLYLIRSTLLTLNDANRSGNYSVLRDLAAPDFQVRNTAADLAQIFADLRRRNFDLFAVALVAPQLTAAPTIDANRMLRLTGIFPTRPRQINFDLTFQVVGGQWRLFGIAVATPEAAPPAQANQAADTAPAKPAPSGKIR
jgi:hypothetical protein